MINLEKIVEEFKEDFQIPPFYSDESLLRSAKEGLQFLKSKKQKEVNLDTDETAKSLLKNYMYYAYFKKLDEFELAFQSQLYSWLMETSE